MSAPASTGTGTGVGADTGACAGPKLAGHALDLSGMRRRAVIGVLPGVWITMFLGTIFHLGNNDVTDALHADRYRMVWFYGTYLFGSATGLASTTYYIPRIGLRRLFISSLIVFAIANGLCTFAPTVEAMAPLRLLVGYSTGLALNAGMLILWRVFKNDEEIAMTVYAAGVYLSALAGVIVGGLVLFETDMWKVLLWMHVPLGLAAACAAAIYLIHDDPEPGTVPPKFDIFGLFLLAAFVATMIGSLWFGHYWGWWISPYFAPFGIGWALATAAFVSWGFFASNPLINLRPLLRRNFGLGIAVKALLAINLYVLTGLLSSYMLGIRSYQWWQAALVFLPALIMAALAMIAGARWGSDRSRKLRIFVGVVIVVAMTWVLADNDLYTSKFETATWLAIWGAGFGLAIGPTMLTVFYGLPKEIQAHSAAVFNIFRSLPVFFAHGVLLITLVSSTDTEFLWLRNDVTYERPIIAETMTRLHGHAEQFGGDSPRVDDQPGVMLGHWVHKKAKVFAWEYVVRLLALITALALLVIPFLHPPKDAAPCLGPKV